MVTKNNIKYIGVNDHQIDLFEGMYKVPNGVSYNSYVILDDKIAVMDSVDQSFGDEWLNNLEKVLNGRKPDYLVVHHMEPDHSANIKVFADKYPDSVIVASSQAFNMMNQFFGTNFADRQLVVKDGSTLELGHHVLTFIGAPMVHWPEVLMSYDSLDKVLFSADAFGKFGALDVDEPWLDEARRYYIGIVGKFGPQVQNVLKKAAALDIKYICSLHGPVLNENLEYYFDKYDKWSSYTPESNGVVLAYTSVYGHTKETVMLLVEEFKKNGYDEIVVHDLARDDMSLCVSDTFKYSHLVLATTTYCTGIFPFMETFLHSLLERNFQNKKVAIIENGTWAPVPAKYITSLFADSKNVEISNVITLKSALSDENKVQIQELAKSFLK